jgi:hypothetical protein
MWVSFIHSQGSVSRFLKLVACVQSVPDEATCILGLARAKVMKLLVNQAFPTLVETWIVLSVSPLQLEI